MFQGHRGPNGTSIPEPALRRGPFFFFLLAGYFVMKGTEMLSQPRHLPPSLKHNATLN